MSNYFMSTLEQIMPTILDDELVKENCENLLLEPKPIGNGIINAKDVIEKTLGNYYHSRFHNPKMFSDQQFKKIKDLYSGKDSKLYLEFHLNMFVELLRNVLFYTLSSNMKFKRKEEFLLKNNTCKKLLSKQLKICGKIKDEIKIDTTENDLFAFILKYISSEQVKSLNFSDRIHEIARSLAFNQSCIPTEDLLLEFFDIYFEFMMAMLDFTKEPSAKVTDYSRVY